MQQLRRKLATYRQEHLLDHWERLSPSERAGLEAAIEQLDLDLCRRLAQTHVRAVPEVKLPEAIRPPRVLPRVPDDQHAELYRRAVDEGERAVRDGRVCVLTVAGGMGTRLAFDGPKGAFPVSPVRDASLFQLFAEQIRGVGRRFGHRPLWYVMTSTLNHDQTVACFEEADYFGLSSEGVRFFPQGRMPLFHTDGRIALEAPDRIAMVPDGHGGSLLALARSGALDEMRRRGIDQISYIQVDNPLVNAVDPLFVGLHRLTGSEMSSKAVRKAHDLERVGNFCIVGGKLTVIEYSDLPEALARRRNPDGTRCFDAGSIAIHVLERSFVERLTARRGDLRLPWHRALKKVPVLGPDGAVQFPAAPNVVKLEMFVFDAIPLAHNPLCLMTEREEEFSPVKNADGPDSPRTARRDMVRRAYRWLDACGERLPTDERGEPLVDVEIVAAHALDVDDLREHLGDRAVEEAEGVVLSQPQGGAAPPRVAGSRAKPGA